MPCHEADMPAYAELLLPDISPGAIISADDCCAPLATPFLSLFSLFAIILIFSPMSYCFRYIYAADIFSC
jgi:hypothetical protein